ncbi:hypothetical protein UQ64_28530 [Paenibacillus etheri]|uniref:catalase n=1 Tax=Paenibacillus etheri TaxID=1306852 RepID=A0A0W1AS04_9BACL|nr:hypothetical protein UQ64_28530 [Paenibacillus etheri]
MITFLFSPWGIEANYRQMQRSGVNTYKWVNEKGEAVLIKYHWEPLKIYKPKTSAMLRKTYMRLLRVGITPNGNLWRRNC